MTIGVIGLGTMGLPIAEHLHERYGGVTGYDVSADRRAILAERGLAVTDDLQSLAANDVLVLLLPNSAIVEAVLLAPELFSALRAGTRVLDMSSSEPLRTIALAEKLRARQVTLIDAPVSGGLRGALAATLTIMVGSTPEDYTFVKGFVQPLGTAVHVGSVGSGHLLKALNNYLSATHLIATAEAMSAGRAFGLDPAVMIDVFNSSSGRSGSTQAKWPQFIAPGNYASGFSLDLMTKDLGIALDAATTLGTATEVARVIHQLWAQAQAELPAGSDHTRIAEWVDHGESGEPVAEWRE